MYACLCLCSYTSSANASTAERSSVSAPACASPVVGGLRLPAAAGGLAIRPGGTATSRPGGFVPIPVGGGGTVPPRATARTGAEGGPAPFDVLTCLVAPSLVGDVTTAVSPRALGPSAVSPRALGSTAVSFELDLCDQLPSPLAPTEVPASTPLGTGCAVPPPYASVFAPSQPGLIAPSAGLTPSSVFPPPPVS